MTTVSVTKFRKHLFEYLDRAAAGETIIIQRNNQNVAFLVPEAKANWRDHIKQTLQTNVSPEELMKPIADIWEDYV
ncbi:MAG: type II toxin-antitoxin system prevent-host-death family antitoxin [Ardenticatenaceae bacterium]|nr:type II toxin-antitoxin system prevent-host-death family antitoxin [Ardenticatenaceae bacterium]